jgi:hypothetical protein
VRCAGRKWLQARTAARGLWAYSLNYVPKYNQPQQHPDIIAERGLPYDAEVKPFALNMSPRTPSDLKHLLNSQRGVLHVRVRSSFLEKPLKTLEAEIPGATNPEERIVLVAHLDHYKPGANDDANGSATLLEISRPIVTSIRAGFLQQPVRTITFLWVDEYRGTGAWMNRNSDHVNNIVAAIVLDMAGREPGGVFASSACPIRVRSGSERQINTQAGGQDHGTKIIHLAAS